MSPHETVRACLEVAALLVLVVIVAAWVVASVRDLLEDWGFRRNRRGRRP